MEEWEFNDALLLTAIGPSSRGRDLSELIGSADAMNHDVLPADQAARAVGRLLASGLVERMEERFRLTEDGKQIYAQRRGGMFEQAGAVLSALRDVALVEGEQALFHAEGSTYSANKCAVSAEGALGPTLTKPRTSPSSSTAHRYSGSVRVSGDHMA